VDWSGGFTEDEFGVTTENRLGKARAYEVPTAVLPLQSRWACAGAVAGANVWKSASFAPGRCVALGLYTGSPGW